jgi:hypothetical protein
MPIKGTTTSYGGRSRGKYSYGNGGLNDVHSEPYKVTQERWDEIFGKKNDEKIIGNTPS